MSNTAEKVTINFTSFADANEKEDILVEGPIKVYATVDNVDALYRLTVPEDQNVVVYVRNVLDSNTRSKSAFYMYDFEIKQWYEVLLGSHSHENKELLDQLGNIDLTNLVYNDHKILTLTKIDTDGVEDTDAAYQYRFEWKDMPNELPEIPDNMLNKPAYLTVENGKYTWKDELIPAQTFQYKQIIVETEEPTKSIQIKNLNYDERYDEILAFDGSDLLADCKFTTEENSETGEKYVLLTLDSPNNAVMFENGEKLTLLVIKSGIAGFMDTLTKEYMTKADAVSLLSGNSISLANYATKQDLKQKANVQHTHTQFSSIGHLHDERYAMYYHTHDQYLARADVYAVISSVLSGLLNQEDPNITEDDVNTIFEDAIKNLRNELLSRIDSYATISYVDSLFNKLQTEYLDTDHVKVNGTAYSLSDYLNLIQNQINDTSNETTNVMLSQQIIVSAGENGSIGGYVNGDVIKAGTSVQQILTKLLTKRIEPELTKPEVKFIDFDAVVGQTRIFEAGTTNLQLKVGYDFAKNDGGNKSAVSLETVIYNESGAIISDNIQSFDPDDNTPKYITIGNVYDGISAKLIWKVFYLKGDNKTDNLGKLDYYVPGGYATAEYVVHGSRYSFIGKYKSNSVRTANAIILDDTNKFTIECKSYNTSKDVVLAFPAKDNIKIESIIYRNQGCDVSDIFDYNDILVYGANNYKPIAYDAYTYHSYGPLNQTLYFDVIISRGDN